MGHLNEPKKQLYQQQVVERAAEKRLAHLELVYRERILPKMEFLQTSLEKLCATLNSLDSAIKVNYFLEGLGRLENLLQSDYQIKADNPAEINELTFQFDCLSDGELQVNIEGKKNVDMYIELLTENKLKFKGKTRKNDKNFVTGAKFIIARYVPVTFCFKADIKNTSIELRIRNYDTLGESCMQFSPEAITEEFMKNLTEYTLRKNKGFFSLDLSEIERRRIRAKVLYEQQQRAAELAAADNMKPENESRKKGFFARLIGG